MKKILIISDLKDSLIEKIKNLMSEGWDLVALPDNDNKAIRDNLLGAEIILTLPWFFQDFILEEANDLKWIQTMTAGADGFPLKKLENKGIILTTVHGNLHAIPISEHVLGMMLIISRKFNLFFEQKRKHEWKEIEGEELNGKAVGILGLGNVGIEIARKCKEFGMVVLGMDMIEAKEPFIDKFYTPSQLNEILSNSDFIVITLPLTKETSGMIGEKELRLMRKSAVLINVARGKIVVEKDLIKALQEKWIAGAGLDVFEVEPLEKNSPFYEMENVVFSSHSATLSPPHYERAVDYFIENFNFYTAGKKLKGLVDYKLGF